MASKNHSGKKSNKTKNLRCSTRLLNEKFQYMSDEKKVIVRKLGFDGLMHIPPINLPHKLLKQLVYSFNVIRNKLDTRHGELFINPENIGAALGLNASGQNIKESIFKRVFIIYIQIVFLLPTTINKVSLIHMSPIFHLDNIKEWNWGSHVLEFIIKGIGDHHLKKKKIH
ncbi:hypothetical protein Ahy_A03g011555 [Arachis hypogaea]|uniref:Aminotransferase-like plant mobile domain-containing protein n=1 Tax=Arachis hypogaea TaxID=3818 RepID=A0A445DR37_ARAHY|nr:hypothetical protein Ahy_A03g011555 [Arachis hypogaea]